MKDKFLFHVPVSIMKADDGSPSKEMRISGIASTDDKDLQKESLMNGGFDLEYFKSHGLINWHHQLKNNPSAVIGVPDRYKTTVRPDGLYVEAVLYPSEMGKAAYDQTLVMEENAHLGRKMGWSIEGKVTERDELNPNIVKRAQITGIALTPMPINPNTFAQVMKAFVDGDDTDLIDKGETVEMDKKEMIDEHKKLVGVLESDSHKDDKKEAKKQKKELEEYMMKSVIGDGGFVKCRKDGTIMLNLGKAMTLSGAAPVMPESVDKKIRNLTYGSDVKKALLAQIYKANGDLTPEQAIAVMNRVLKQKS